MTTFVPYRPTSGLIIEEIDNDRLLSKGKGSSYNCHIQNKKCSRLWKGLKKSTSRTPVGVRLFLKRMYMKKMKKYKLRI